MTQFAWSATSETKAAPEFDSGADRDSGSIPELGGQFGGEGNGGTSGHKDHYANRPNRNHNCHDFSENVQHS